MRPALLAPLAAVALLLAFPGAAAADEIDRAARALAKDAVYVDPAAERAISPAEANRLRARIKEGDAGRLYIAILPGSALDAAGGDPNEVVAALARRLNRDATYAVVVGVEFRAASTVLGPGKARRLGERAFRQSRDKGETAVLLSFVDAVADERSRNGSGSGRAAILALIVAAIFVLYRRWRSSPTSRLSA